MNKSVLRLEIFLFLLCLLHSLMIILLNNSFLRLPQELFPQTFDRTSSLSRCFPVCFYLLACVAVGLCSVASYCHRFLSYHRVRVPSQYHIVLSFLEDNRRFLTLALVRINNHFAHCSVVQALSLLHFFCSFHGEVLLIFLDLLLHYKRLE